MDFEPEIIRSSRRTLSVEIGRDLRVIVRAPRRLPERSISARPTSLVAPVIK